jgi:carbonic anhydrase/acetyltransferase-like protein (isoleucine patch superfamily)
MAHIVSCRGFTPKIAPDVFLAPTAAIIGDVEIQEKCSIWFSAIIRGDVMPIRIGKETNIQDGTLIHGTYKKCGTTIGNRVSVGHNVILHGCEVGDRTLVGMGCVIMDQASIKGRCIIGAGSLITEGKVFEEGWLILGRPAKAVRLLTTEELAFLDKSSENYLLYQSWYDPQNEGSHI